MTDVAVPTETTGSADSAREALLQVRREVAKAVVGQDAAVTGLVIALLCRGHVLLEGVPGVAKTLLVRSLAAALDARHQAGAVHPRPDARRRHRLAGLRRAHRRVLLPRGPGLHQPAARRRDQPDPAEDPGRPAGGDGGAAGLGRRDAAPAARARSWSPRPRTRSSTRAPTRCPRPSSTGSCSSSTLPLPPREDEVLVLHRHASGFDPRDLHAAGLRPVAGPADLDAGAQAVRAVTVAPEVAGYIVDLARATRQSPSLSLGVSPARRDRAAGDQPRVGVALRPRLRHPRRREGARPLRPCAHRVTLRPEAELEGVDVGSVLASALAAVPVPR